MHVAASQSLAETLRGLSITRGRNDLLIGADGREYIDLFTGCGTVFLGHGNRAISDAVHKQLDDVWNVGALQTQVQLRASNLIETFLPPNYRVAALYSTGMEAAEFALRIGRVCTGRKGVVGFEGSMHGKSTATAYLGWANDLVSLADFQRLPYVPTHSEDSILKLLATTLASESISAVFVEPLQGSAGGHAASPGFFQGVRDICTRYGTLLIFDEILTGFHRTGDAFLFQKSAIHPDVILIGKAMGNGFPVSGVVVDRNIPIEPAMLPGSTFAGNPLAASVVEATLTEMKTMDMRAAVSRIGATIAAELGPLRKFGIAMGGEGALWILDLPPNRLEPAVATILRNGVIVGPTGSQIRLLPPATISDDHLIRACRIVREAIQ